MVENKSNKRVGIIMVLIDGIADYSNATQDARKTTLQEAQIPTMQALINSRDSFYGVHDPVQSGLACGSDTAHMSLFGYDPLKIYDGRGMLESMGSGLITKVGDIAFKSNFAYMDINSRIVERRRVDREFPNWGIPLCQAINGLKVPGYPDQLIECQYATEHRCAIKVSGPRLSSSITGNDPLKDNLPIVKCEASEPSDPDSVFTAELIEKLSETIIEVLLEHPINKARKEQGLPYTNMITLRGAGQRVQAASFLEKHGLKAFMIAPTAIIRGVGLTFQMDLLDDVEGMTGYYDSNLRGKCLRAAKEFIENENSYDFGFVHVKAVDDAGHDKSRPIKVEQLEKVDRAIAEMVESLGGYLDSQKEQCDFILCITGDHTTPAIYGDHTYEPVPVVFGSIAQLWSEMQAGQVQNKKSFDEIFCSGGSPLGRFEGSQLMTLLKQYREYLINN